MGMSASEPDELLWTWEAERPALRVRRLGEQDRPEMQAFFATSPGYCLFLSANLSYLRSSMDLVRFWGGYRGSDLVAVLMMVGQRATMYAEPEVDLSGLAQVALEQQVDFVMGEAACVRSVVRKCSRQKLVEVREHVLADYALAPGKGLPVVPPPGVLVRRAGLGDLETLTDLYYRTDGFESLARDQLRRTLYTRIHTLRTWIAEVRGRAVSAASTSAETEGAAMVGGVWTTEMMRSRGLSTAVVGALSRELVDEGRRPFLFYLADNEIAARVYEHVGYASIGRWLVAYLKPTGPSE